MSCKLFKTLHLLPKHNTDRYSPNYTTRSNYCDELVSKTHLRLVSFHCSLPSHLRLPRTLKADEKTVTPHVLQFQ